MDFEQLRLLDLLDKFNADITEIAETHSLKRFKQAGANLQNVYDFCLLSQNTFEDIQDVLKNLFSSFNYGAIIVNDAIKNGKLNEKDAELLAQCLEVMQKCVLAIKGKLK